MTHDLGLKNSTVIEPVVPPDDKHFRDRERLDAQPRLKKDSYYQPPGLRYMGPHPHSEVRRNYQDDKSIDMKKVFALRKLGGAVIPTFG